VQSPAHAPVDIEQRKGAHGVVTGAGHVVAEPVHVAATVATPATHEAVRHTVVALANASAGHTVVVPLQDSGASQTSAAARQTVVEGSGLQVPTKPVARHDPQRAASVLPHALSQQTPSTQNPLKHSDATVQSEPSARARR
jgi:hypothetical protein